MNEINEADELKPVQPRERRSAQRSRHPAPLLAYLVALFAVAFALLLLSYFMHQRRSDRELISGLRESASAMQTVTTVMDMNKQLEEENEQLKQQVAELENASGRAELESTAKALDWLWRIEREYFRKHPATARAMIQAFEETGLPAALPEKSLTDPEYRSPAEQYRAIHDDLF